MMQIEKLVLPKGRSKFSCVWGLEEAARERHDTLFLVIVRDSDESFRTGAQEMVTGFDK